MENFIFRNAKVSTARSLCSNFMGSIYMSSILQTYSSLTFALTPVLVM
jgi:hypothetical protein